jgi:hypothetical protein
MPPLSVQRSNSTTAGLGYLEVSVGGLSMQIHPFAGWSVSALAQEWRNSSTELTSFTDMRHISADPAQESLHPT